MAGQAFASHSGHGHCDPIPRRAREDPMLDARVAIAEREFVLDQILTDLWKGRLTPEAAVGRIMAKLGMGRRAAQDEVDGFLRD
jgi:hypothetical protein